MGWSGVSRSSSSSDCFRRNGDDFDRVMVLNVLVRVRVIAMVKEGGGKEEVVRRRERVAAVGSVFVFVLRGSSSYTHSVFCLHTPDRSCYV